MKIAMTITVDVDPAEWDGGGRSAAELRQDVKEYVSASVAELALVTEAGAAITVR
ncbi:hypothetical protein K1T35_47780 (plasmid) [Pseudonocardia sp. DSM 110487]|uniref:hypothetical protein n=1 Tax=Pseudonocardia sp. DSM 110487 TaxID=2865833 RepID=UPI001C6A602C|nr:hypothetical protein [Pseudonocardia sp. DSM 110487]QYN41052.1 hypothetical protein K1T35_47780 [Pseudonocardia sp. DSM 110487]